MQQTEFLHKVMPFKDKLFRLAKRLLVSTEEAEDATQEVLMKLWSNKKKIFMINFFFLNNIIVSNDYTKNWTKKSS